MKLDRKVVNKKIVDRKVVDRKIISKKSSNPVGVLRKKTNALYVRLQLRRVGLKDEIEA